jgi:serine beta-lactamase-like protein LACTB, mitochondrial
MIRSITIIFLLIFTSLIYSQNLNRLFEDYLVNYYVYKNVPSVSAGFLSNGKIQWTGTKGFSDIENSVPATNKTLYRTASISKSVTAVAIMQLVESGKIRLDDYAWKYIPYLPSIKKPFTVRQLLNHTSGIRTYYENEFDSKSYFSTTRDVVLYIMKDTLQYNPGEKYLYTTLGYNLLAAIIENVSGLDYAEYMKMYIFDPCDMRNTIPDYQKGIIHNRARGYIRDMYRQIENAPLADLSIKYAGGGLLSTAEDLLKFTANLLEGKLIKHATLDSMLVPTRLNNGRYVNYGLGFAFETDETGRRFFSHSGGGTGFASHLIIYPVEKIASVYLINIRDRNLEDPAKAIISIALGKELLPVKRSLSDRLMEEYITSSVDSVISLCRKIEADSTAVYNISVIEMNFFGNDLIKINRIPDAIEFYKYVINEYPDYASAYIGIADAYYADGNRGLALKNYRTAMKLDPKNNYVSGMVKKINDNK